MLSLKPAMLLFLITQTTFAASGGRGKLGQGYDGVNNLG